MPRNWNDACAKSCGPPMTVGGWTRPISGSRESDCIYAGLSTPAVRRSTSSSRRVKISFADERLHGTISPLSKLRLQLKAM